MRCSDVSEFEHIYSQILTTPSCVFGRLFTWTRMVDVNALIVWKTFSDICFSVKSSLWASTAAYTKFQRMIWSMIWSCGHRSRSPMCTVQLPHRNAGRTLWFPGGSSHYRSRSAYLDSNFDGIDAVLTLFCANNMTSNIQHGVTCSHYPSVSGEPQPRAFRGWKLGWVAP